MQMQTGFAMDHNTPDFCQTASGREKLLKAEDLEAWLNIDVKTIYAYARHNRIPHIRIYRSIRFRLSEIRDWLDTHSSPNRRGRRKTQ